MQFEKAIIPSPPLPRPDQRPKKWIRRTGFRVTTSGARFDR